MFKCNLLLGDDRVVQQGVPALLHLSQSEPAAELHSQVNCSQVCGLKHSTHTSAIFFEGTGIDILKT